MNAETIFQKALVSRKPEGVLYVAQVFESMGDTYRATMLYNRLRPIVAFGAMARGTAIKGTNGAVIPPGRYWQDFIGDPAKKAWAEWIKSKPEVHVETTEDHSDENRIFAIFTIPTTANNYGLAGLFYPTQLIGFPTIAPVSITSSADTIQRPDPVTSADVLADMAKVAGKTTKSFGEGLGLSSTTLALLGGGLLVGLFLLNKLMIPIPKLI
jgi:hypothetical protein